MEAVFLKLLNMSIAAGWLVLVVVVLRVLLKRAPKHVLCILWALVACRLLCPISLESVLSLIPSAETIPQNILYSQEPEIHSGILMLNTVVNPVLSEELAPAPGDSVNPMQIVIYIASRVWFAGVLGMMLYACISYYRIHRRVAVSMQQEGNLYICDDIESPFILGVMKPRIYLPSALEEDKKEYVIAHERAHLKRCDHWWKPLGFVLLEIYWFHPLMWLSYALLCRDIELACDERVIRELGEEQKKPYSEALLYCSVPRKMIVACPLAFGEVGVKERVKTVLHYKKPAFWVIVATGLVCVVVAVCFLTNPKGSLEEANPLGHSYFVKEISYTAPRNMLYSIVYRVEGLPLYGFTSDITMFQKKNRLTADTAGVLPEINKEWLQLGTLQEIELTADNFDKYFKSFNEVSDLGWKDGMTAKKFRRENKAAWEILTGGEFDYYLLQQKDNSVYLAVWDNALEGDYVRWLFHLERADRVSCTIETPGESAFYELERYPNLPLEGLYEDMPMAEVDESGVLLFHLDGTPKSLQVLEEHYWRADGEWCKEELGELTLTPNSEGKYVVELSRRQQSEMYSVYIVLYQDGKYVMRVRYPDKTGTEGDVTQSTEPDGKENDLGNSETEHMFQNSSEQMNGGAEEQLGEQENGQPEDMSPLDMAIRKAILGKEADKNIKGVLFNCASHITLATETVCGVPLENGGKAKEYVTAYAWVMMPSYVYKYPTNALVSSSDGFWLAILNFEVGEDGEYILEEHLNIEGIVYARDPEKAKKKYDITDSSYKKRFRQMLPEEVKEAMDDELMYLYWLTWDCYEQAIQDAGVDTEVVISGLLDEALRNEYTWKEARELTYYGKYTLQYCFKEFLKGGQTGERGELMEEACKKIAEYSGEPALSEIKVANGQEWFEAVKEKAEQLQIQYGFDVLAEEYPVSWLVLEMAEK